MTFWGYNNCKETYGEPVTPLAQVDDACCQISGDGNLEFPVGKFPPPG